jgi:bifunctional ADP-heptose synthase (sugar kinase/adenylyltransferase)
MGIDEEICSVSPSAEHDFRLDELVVNRGGAGMAQIHRCRWCGAQAHEAHEASAAGDA